MVGLGGECSKDERRHHVQSANSIWTVIMSTLLTTVMTLPQRARLQALSLVVGGLQATTAGAEPLTEDSDTTAPIPDSSQVSMRLLVLEEGHIWLTMGLVTAGLDMLHGSVNPFVVLILYQAEQVDQFPSSLEAASSSCDYMWAESLPGHTYSIAMPS
eukprot:215083-Amphidinium_carterae.5